jgi:HAD superfamily hydrolase (TIGR01549 family)
VKGIIFDLDDTLVKTNLDFSAIKRDIGCPRSDDILTFISKITCLTTKALAHKTVLEHELHDAETSTWLPGAWEFVQAAKRQDLPLAIVTRNCREATFLKIKKNNITIDQVFTREDAPAKPDPTALLTIAAQWNIDVEHIAYVGDYIYDVQAAHNAEMQAWLYKYQAEKSDYKACLSYIAKN